MNNYRQGDVYILSCKSFPEGVTKNVKEKVLAYGEVTGHKHVLKPVNDCKIEIVENADGCYIKTFGETEIVHEEHGTITLPKGIYEIRIQREYDPIEYARRVAD